MANKSKKSSNVKLPTYKIISENVENAIGTKENVSIYLYHEEEDVSNEQLEAIMQKEINKYKKKNRHIGVYVYDYYNYPGIDEYDSLLWSSMAIVNYYLDGSNAKPKYTFNEPEYLDYIYKAFKEENSQNN